MHMVTSLLQENKELKKEAHEAPMETAGLLVAYLEQLGVDYVFGVPGGAIEPFYNALARSTRNGRVRHILARHEAGAAFMADGYARETGKIGVCVSTSGPGATNLITGVACAYDNHVPMLVITGQPALPAFGRHPLQESSCTGIDVLGMFRHCTRYNTLISHPKQLEQKLSVALQRAMRSPRGPVHLSVPMDVFSSPSPVRAPSYDLHSLLSPAYLVDEQTNSILKRMVTESRQTVLMIGGRCAGAINVLMAFAEKQGAAIVTTPDGKGLISPAHPLYRGVFGLGGHDTAERALKNAGVDLILAAGVSMGEWNSGGWSDNLMNGRLVHIDEAEEILSFTPMARLHVCGDIGATFLSLLKKLPEDKGNQAGYVTPESGAGRDLGNENDVIQSFDEPEKFFSDASPIKPQRLMRELSRLFPPTTRYLADTGNSVSWAAHYLQPGGYEQTPSTVAPDQSGAGWLRVVMNFAPMGWAIGGAIGTAAASPGAPVVCITGDGSMLMNGQELSVAVAQGLTVIFVVLNDGALGMVSHGQRLSGAEQIGCELPPTDFAALAKALGAPGYIINSPDDLLALDIAAICSRRGPTLLDVRIDAEEVPPISVRIRTLANK